MTYWLSTIFLCLFLLWSAYTYIFSKSTIKGVRELGFPDFFRIQLAILKIIAILILIIPQTPMQWKQWAYAGVFLFFVTAIIAHAVHKDPIFINLINAVLLVILIVSNVYLHRLY